MWLFVDDEQIVDDGHVTNHTTTTSHIFVRVANYMRDTCIAIHILPPTVFFFASHELYESHITCHTTNTEGADRVCPYPLNQHSVQYPHDDVGCLIEGAHIQSVQHPQIESNILKTR